MMPPRLYCWVDRKTCIVAHKKRAVALTLMQFAIFMVLYGPKRGQPRNSRRACYLVPIKRADLLDEIYRGVAEPPLSIKDCLTVTVFKMNVRLKHLGLRVVGTNRGKHSSYRLVRLES